jgi:hypothetical protein
MVTEPSRSRGPRSLGAALLLAGLLWLLPGCEREMLDPLCTPVAPGQLVITEIRGPQEPDSTYGQWIEIFNAGTSAVNVAALKLRITQLDGSGEKVITIRDADLTIAAGDYLVLGRQPADLLPAWVDYGYGDEVIIDLYQDGMMDLSVCNTVVDSIVYRSLPLQGTLALDGALVPSAEANDLESNWCNDASEVWDPVQTGIPGTPGAQNRPCP